MANFRIKLYGDYHIFLFLAD